MRLLAFVFVGLALSQSVFAQTGCVDIQKAFDQVNTVDRFGAGYASNWATVQQIFGTPTETKEVSGRVSTFIYAYRGCSLEFGISTEGKIQNKNFRLVASQSSPSVPVTSIQPVRSPAAAIVNNNDQVEVAQAIKSLDAPLAYSQGTPALLRCSFNGGLDVYARAEPSSPILARIKCGDPLVLIDGSGFPHVRTQGGKDGFILSHNLGQWSIVPDASASKDTAPVPSRPLTPMTSSSNTATTPGPTSTPDIPASSPKVSTSSPSTSTTEPRPTAIDPGSAPRRDTSRTKISDIKIHGYVTAVNSRTSFDIEDYRITRDAAFKLEFENASPDLSFNIEDVRVGTELEIKGIYDDATGELQAKSIKVDMEQFRKLKDTAILDRPPSGVQQVNGGWRGIFFR